MDHTPKPNAFDRQGQLSLHCDAHICSALQAAAPPGPDSSRGFPGSSLASSQGEATLCPACAVVQAEGSLVGIPLLCSDTCM